MPKALELMCLLRISIIKDNKGGGALMTQGRNMLAFYLWLPILRGHHLTNVKMIAQGKTIHVIKRNPLEIIFHGVARIDSIDVVL